MLTFIRKPDPRPTWVINLWFCIFILLTCNFSFWRLALADYPFSIEHLPFLLSMALVLSAAHYFFITLISFKYSFKPVLVILLLLGAISAYAMDTYGYIISVQAYQNLFATDSKELQDLFSVKLIAYLACIFLLPSALVLKSKLAYLNTKKLALQLLIALLVIVGNIVIFNKSYTSFLRNHKQLRYYVNPIRPVYALGKFIRQHFQDHEDASFKILDPAPSLGQNLNKPRLIVLVVGESDRAINHSLNGYARNTNPKLSQRDDVISFTQVSSCGTETSVSVPCMFSAYPRENYNYSKGRYSQNLLDILHASGVQVLWRDNDSGCKNVCDRVPTDDFNNSKIEPYCNSFECHDEILLHELQSYIDANTQDKLIVLHKKGNHGPAYYKRYPKAFEVFTPVCESNELQDCTDVEIINTYDNIILYTDYFLDKLIAQLENNNNKYQTAMLYISDHGESLGEKGIYLHAMPYWLAPKEQTHVPFLFWSNADFALDKKQLVAMQDQALSHDNLFHTVLGLFQVQTQVYDINLDILGTKND